jgi:hypothetical protein
VRLLAVLAVAAVAAASAWAADVHVIQGDKSVGGIRLGRSTPDDVRRLFGPATSARQAGPAAQSCVRVWEKLKLEVEFFTFETQPCLRGVALIVTVRSRASWRTALGLRIGDTAARVRSLYPRARLRGTAPDRGYWLVTRQICAEVGGGAYPGLLARVRNGRVSALVARIAVCD